MPLQFRSTKHEVVNYLKVVAIGAPGSGKTRFGSTFPNPVYADAEGLLLSIRDRDIPATRIDSIDDLKELYRTLAQEPKVREKMIGRPVDTVVIDTVDEISRIVMKERLAQRKLETPEISDWGYLGETMARILRQFRNLDMHVLFAVHIKADQDQQSGRIEYSPAVQGATASRLPEFGNEVFLLTNRSSHDPETGRPVVQRFLQTYPDARHPWIKDHSGCMPPEFPINFDDDFERMAALIFGGGAGGQTTTGAHREGAAGSPAEPTEKKPARRKLNLIARETDDPPPEKPETVEAPAPQPEPTVPGNGTEPDDDDPLADLGADVPDEAPAATGGPVCSVCGELINPPDYAEFSEVRFGVPLCRAHFAERAAAK